MRQGCGGGIVVYAEIDFIEAIDRFYTSKTYLTLQQVENGLWAESPEYIADRFMEETGCSCLNQYTGR